MKFIGVSDLKKYCTAVINEIQKNGEEVIVTKKGVPVALIRPVNEDEFVLKQKGETP